jgi:hypothetical protein
MAGSIRELLGPEASIVHEIVSKEMGADSAIATHMVSWLRCGVRGRVRARVRARVRVRGRVRVRASIVQTPQLTSCSSSTPPSSSPLPLP